MTPGELARRAVFLQRTANAAIEYELNRSRGKPVDLSCDDRLVGQALTNLLQNAADSIARRPEDSA